MNNTERKELFHFPEALDQILMDKFGPEIEAESGYNIFTGCHVTNFIAEGERREQINLFIEAFILGNNELRERLLNLKK